MEAQRITFSLVDNSAGFETSPERVRLGDLAGFAADVATFLRGEGKEMDANAVEVAVKPGSLAIETSPMLVTTGLFHDLQALLTTELLDGVDARRREVMERWQKAARLLHGPLYRISAAIEQRTA